MFRSKGRFFRLTACALALSVLVVGAVPARSLAYVVGNEVLALSADASSVSDRDTDMAKAQRVLESKAVSERLLSIGLDEVEIKTRLAALSDGELHHFASTIDDIYPGGSALGLLVGVLIVIMIVFAVLKITDHKIIIQ